MAQFNFTYDSNVSLKQRVGFQMAAAIWSSFLQDNVSINLHIGATEELGENGQAVGGAIPIFHEAHYGIYQDYLEQDATSSEDASVLDAIQEGNTIDILVDTDGNPHTASELVDGNTEIMLTRAQAKALGMEETLVLENGSTWDRDVLQNPNRLDGHIIINSSYSWNYDFARDEAAPKGTLDFLTMALHEIGHNLGFVSGLDGLLKTFELHSGETRSEGFTPLDLMRFSETSTSIDNPDGSVSDLSFGGAAYFSLDGGATMSAEFEEGNDYQASHWQRFQYAIGIMDPTLGYQERTDISHLDLQAFDVLGWDVDYAALQHGLDFHALYDQAKQAVILELGDVEAVEVALTSGQDWQMLGYEAWFAAFKQQIIEQGWGTWFQGFESHILEQGWGTWFQDFEAQLLQQGWGTWFQDFETQLLEQGWGTWFQDFETQMLEQGWGTWFQAFESQLLEQLWGTWFQTFEPQMLEQLWGTWFQDFEAQVLEQGWGTWFQSFESQILEQGWGTWFQSFEGEMLNQNWGTWFQSFDVQTLNQSWGTWFQNFDAQVLEQGWGTWFQNFESQILEQGWGTWFQDFETQLLEQGWGTWFQEIDAQLLEQGWGTWFQKFEEQVLEQGWGTWWQQKEGYLNHFESNITIQTSVARTALSTTAIAGGIADDILAGSVGQDLIKGYAGDDFIDGKDGDDILLGNAGNDIAYGWHGEDVIFGGDGDDVLAGENDNDQAYGEAGHDILSGGRGDDYLDGGEGRDVLNGDMGNDTLKGGKDNDQLNGGSGKDFLIGGIGKDTVTGGSGDDILYGDDYFVPVISANTNTVTDDDTSAADTQADVPPASPALDFWIRLEAEDIKLRTYSEDDQVEVSGGSVIEIQSNGTAITNFDGPSRVYDFEDQGNLDHLESAAVDPSSVSPSSEPIRVEAENMTLAGDYLFEDQVFASEGRLIKTNSNFTATTEFTGGAGLYNIIIGYYDENDGNSAVTVKLDGLSLDSWTFDQDLGNRFAGTNTFVTRIVATAVSLDAGAVLELQGSRDSSEYARIDYIEFVAVDNPETSQLGLNGDILRGGAGNDTAYGGEGNDILYGESGNDTLYGDFTAAKGEATTIFASSFEGIASTGFVEAPFDGWSSTDGYLEVWSSQSADGNIHIELNNDPTNYYQDTSQIFRTIETIAGARYFLSFQYAPRNGYSANVNALDVRLGEETLLTVAEDGTNDTGLNWKTYTVSFEGDGSTQALEFVSTGQAVEYGRGARLDDIKLIAESPTAKLPSESSEASATVTNGAIYSGSRYLLTDPTMTWEEAPTYNDRLIGSSGNDILYGDAGNDVLNGTDEKFKGALEQDTLTGGSGADQFILGDKNNAYYSNDNNSDYAIITDFISSIDTIQLHGSIANYQQSLQGSNIFLYYGSNQDLVAKFENISHLDLNKIATFV